MTTHTIRTDKWYVEWNILSKHEQALFHIGFQLPTPKDKTFFISLSMFTLSVFWLEIHKYTKPLAPLINLDAYISGMLNQKPDAYDKWLNRAKEKPNASNNDSGRDDGDSGRGNVQGV